MVFRLDRPVAITEDAARQAELIFSTARVSEYSSSSGTEFDSDVFTQKKGLSLKDLSEAMTLFGSISSADGIVNRLKQFVLADYTLEDMTTTWEEGGRYFSYKCSFYGLVESGLLTALVLVSREEVVRQMQERLVSRIAQGLSVSSGEDFFINLVRQLTETLGIDFAAVAELVPEKQNIINILAVYSNQRQEILHKNVEISVVTGPDLELIAGKEVIYPANVGSRFPQDVRLKNFNIESYIGVPIMGEAGRQLGFITLMHCSEMPNLELAYSVARIFADRAGVAIENRRIWLERRQRDNQQKIFIENNPNGMFVVDIVPPMPLSLSVHRQVQWLADNSRFVDSNKALRALFGLQSTEQVLTARLYGSCVSYDFATQAKDFISQDYLFRDKLIHMFFDDSREMWLSTNISSVIVSGELTQMLGMVSDVSGRIFHTREMEYRAQHDGLTGLPNRSFFIEQLDRLLSVSSPANKHALFMLDLDGFKEVNDTLGHETGDFLLKQIGPRLESLLSASSSILARLGGDEFAVLVDNYESVAMVTELASRLMQELKTPFSINDLELVVGGSMGIALYPDNSQTSSSLLRCADIAMYQAKQQSLDYCFYSTDRDHYTVRRLSLMMDIRQAVENDELLLFYQPIIGLQDQQVVGFEALIRWQHPELGMLSPKEFIPLIELTEMIMPVTWWVVETAIKQLAVWAKQGLPYRLSVNVSTRNLIDVGFVSFIEKCLQRYKVEGKYLDVEITESTLMSDPEKARAVLQSIAALGVLISIDDYGTGYSSLAYLKSLPINTLKIDRAFISQMVDDSYDEIIVHSTIQLAHNLGLKVTAEGIEDGAIIKNLQDLGCDKGQGYYFCKPIPVVELYPWLAEYEARLAGAAL